MTKVQDTTVVNSLPKRYITITEAAESLNISERTLYRVITNKKIPYIKLDQAVRIPIDFAKYLEVKP